MDGTLDLWDYFYKQNDPTLTVQVADKCLTSVSPESNGRMLAVGAADASVTLLELCDGLCMMQTGEKVRQRAPCLLPALVPALPVWRKESGRRSADWRPPVRACSMCATQEARTDTPLVCIDSGSAFP
jgi:hypothetical protein